MCLVGCWGTTSEYDNGHSSILNIMKVVKQNRKKEGGDPPYQKTTVHQNQVIVLLIYDFFFSSCVCVVPEAFSRGDGNLIADEAVLIKVEDGELARCHHVALWVGHDPFPGLAQR